MGFQGWWKSLTGEQEEAEEAINDDEDDEDDDSEEFSDAERDHEPKADLNKSELRYGQTPLYIAAAKGHLSV